MYNKIRISGKIIVESGLHIGGSSQFSAIGAVDAPVIRDTVTKQPIIPGSSLKGKMRTLLARYYSENNIVSDPNGDPEEIIQLFGSSKKSKRQINDGGSNDIVKGRLQFRDAQFSNQDFLSKHMIDSPVEVKFENTIDRLTAEAKPRQIERVIRTAEFDFELIYDAWFKDSIEAALESIKKDFEIIGDGLSLLQLDYLGGNGSRGYGKIKFDSINVEQVFGDDKIDAPNLENLLKAKL